VVIDTAGFSVEQCVRIVREALLERLSQWQRGKNGTKRAASVPPRRGQRLKAGSH